MAPESVLGREVDSFVRLDAAAAVGYLVSNVEDVPQTDFASEQTALAATDWTAVTWPETPKDGGSWTSAEGLSSSLPAR